MIDTANDIHPLVSFQENSVEFLHQLKITQRPITLTVDGKPEAVLQDPAAYQRLLDIAAAADAREGIRQGLADASAGRTRPIEEFFDEFRKKHHIPR